MATPVSRRVALGAEHALGREPPTCFATLNIPDEIRNTGDALVEHSRQG